MYYNNTFIMVSSIMTVIKPTCSKPQKDSILS